jgi:hypothetical protein
MSVQAFGLGQNNTGRTNAPNAFVRYSLAGNDAHEIENTQTAAHARHASRGQHVVRARDVITGGLRRKLVEED